ncbi:major facilitator superfamily domain-containing protein [Aspergillus keveii]|uniref:Major facilitator superfamily domain-containing protein n=1 Tax=Aspergillus keveii TaxID=714993 RepID=A0ABR4FPX6_9EURO
MAPDEEPPNGGYGWVCTVAGAVSIAHSWGFNSAYAVFLAYYLDNGSFKGASQLDYAFVGSLSLTATCMVSPIATAVTHRFGIRKTMLIGTILETASLLCASAASRIWHLFLTQGVLFGVGMGMLFIPVASVVPQWFTTKRSLAAGISVSGAGIGGLVYSLATEAAIRNLGLAWTFRVLGILAFTVNTTCVLLIKDRNHRRSNRACQHNQERTDKSKPNVAMDLGLFRNGNFLLLIGFGVFTIFGYFILIFSLAHYGTEIGLTPSHASLISALDSVGRVTIAGVTTFLAGVICLSVWVNAQNFGVLIFFAIAAGLVAGNFWATIAPLVAEVLGIEKVPSGMNLVWLSIVVPSTFSQPIALVLTEATGSFLASQLFVGFMYIAASVCLGWLFLRTRLRTRVGPV